MIPFFIQINPHGKWEWYLRFSKIELEIFVLLKLKEPTLSKEQFMILQFNYEAFGIEFEETFNGLNKEGLSFKIVQPDYTKLN